MGQVSTFYDVQIFQGNFHSGKTLILEEATMTLTQRENTSVVFIMALGETILKQTDYIPMILVLILLI